MRRVAVLSACAVLGACTVLSPRPDPSRFFVLTVVSDPAVPARPGLSLGIGPVTFPRYLDRSEIVTRVGPNEVRPATFDYWAGSLPAQFQGALAQDLQVLAGAERTQLYPWYAGSAPAVVVEIDVREFEAAADGQARLSARWRIRKGPSGEMVRAGESTLARPVGGADPGSAAAALSALVGELSRELAPLIAGA